MRIQSAKWFWLLGLFFLASPVLCLAQTFERNLYFGIRSDSDVLKLQEFLTDEGMYDGPITGNFFSLTLQAVRQYQEREGVAPAAGYFGPLTRTKANAALSRQLQASENQAVAETGATTTPPTPPKTLNDVASTTQQQLDALLKQVALLQAQLASQAQLQQTIQQQSDLIQTQNQVLQQIQQNTQAIQQNTTPPPPPPSLEPAEPFITVASAGRTLEVGSTPVIRFTVAAGAPEQFSWKKVQLYVQVTGATMAKPDWARNTPSATGNVKIKDLSSGTNLSIGTVYSGSSVTDTTTSSISGGSSGYATMILESEEVIAAGKTKSYEVSLTFADVSPTPGAASVVVSLNREETSVVSALPYDAVEGVEDGSPSFIWSDNSAVGHSTKTADWSNGVYLRALPSDLFTTKN